jgi:hypothetical protein
MTYAQGGLIQASDYNGFANTGSPNFNNIWATGSGSNGYGQTALAQVTAGQIVSHTEWDNLINGIANAAAHQGTTITSITPPVAGATVAFLSALSTNLGAVTATANVLNANTVGASTSNSAVRTTNWGANTGTGTVTSNVTVSFASANQARFFFNAGGVIKIQTSKTAGVGTPEDTAWVNLTSNIGTLGLPAANTTQTIAGQSFTGLTKIGGGGSTPSTFVHNGFYNLTGTSTLLFKQFSSTTAYTGDFIQLSYSANTTAVTVAVQFTDTNANAAITGNLTVTAVAVAPETTNIANTWGTPTVTVSAPA